MVKSFTSGRSTARPVWPHFEHSRQQDLHFRRPSRRLLLQRPSRIRSERFAASNESMGDPHPEHNRRWATTRPNPSGTNEPYHDYLGRQAVPLWRHGRCTVVQRCLGLLTAHELLDAAGVYRIHSVSARGSCRCVGGRRHVHLRWTQRRWQRSRRSCSFSDHIAEVVYLPEYGAKSKPAFRPQHDHSRKADCRSRW